MLLVGLRAAGTAMLVLAALYPIYPRRFRWAEQLRRVEPLTRQVFWVHIGFIILLLLLQGVLLTGFPQLVVAPNGAATALLAGMFAFWLYRLVAQLFLYDSALLPGPPAHLTVHVIFTVLWIGISAVLGWALVTQRVVAGELSR